MTEPTNEVVSGGDPVVPVISRASFANSTTRVLAEAMKQQNDPISVQRRWGIVQAIDVADDSLTVTLGGEPVEGLKYDANYTPTVGETVYMDVVGPDVVVMGTMAPSLYNPGHRKGTVTSVNSTRTRVTVTADDGSILTNIPAVAPYIPHNGDVIHLLAYFGEYAAFGRVSDTAQIRRGAVGDIEMSLTVKPGTLALNGQVVSRTTYSQLWAWVQANSLVTAGMFTNGDGSTTFGLPDFRGRVPVGAGVLGSDTYAVGTTAGSARVTLATNQMPAHDHSVAVANHATHTHGVAVATHGTHDHPADTGIAGGHQHTGGTDTHPGHFHDVSGRTFGGDGEHRHSTLNPRFVAAGGNIAHDHAGGGGTVAEGPGAVNGVAAAQFTTDNGLHDHDWSGRSTTNGLHNHTYTTNGAGDHDHLTDVAPVSAGPHTVTENAAGPTTHTVTETTVGGTTAVDVRQPSIGVQFVVWT